MKPPALRGLEAGVHSNDHLSLRLWLRLLSCSTSIESAIRQRLRTEFGTTLARFDYLAQLYRHPDGLRMNALSRNLMVTGGNVTGLTDQLEKDGLVERINLAADRRSILIQLTAKGREQFAAMASVHETWVLGLFEGLPKASQRDLYAVLGDLRQHITNHAQVTNQPIGESQ